MLSCQGKEERQRPGTDASKRKDGRYETRATLHSTLQGPPAVSFYGATAEEANNAKFQALADQARGVLLSDPHRLTVSEFLERWLSDMVKFQVAESIYARYERPFANTSYRSSSAYDSVTFQCTYPGTEGTQAGSGYASQPCRRLAGSPLSTAFNQAVYDGLIPANPCARVKKAAARGETPVCALSPNRRPLAPSTWRGAPATRH
jgi:hypothetical protein